MAAANAALRVPMAVDPGRRVIGIGEMLVSADPDETLVTFALGSCLGIVVHDPVARVAGLLHAMLPQSSIDPEKARQRPAMYVDSGVPELFRSCYRLGARKERLVLKVAGGASARDEATDQFQIGKRNFVMLRQLLWKNGVLVHAQDVGGTVSRTLTVSVATGVVTLRKSSVDVVL
jgi:chemotaxis protein CheD